MTDKVGAEEMNQIQMYDKDFEMELLQEENAALRSVVSGVGKIFRPDQLHISVSIKFLMKTVTVRSHYINAQNICHMLSKT